MTEHDPAEHPESGTTGAHEGNLLGGEWRLGRRLARHAAGDLYEAEHETTRAAAAVWVLAPRAARDAITRRLVRRMVQWPAQYDQSGALRFLQTVQDEALGVTYVVLQRVDERAQDVAQSWLRLLDEVAEELPSVSEPGATATEPPAAAGAEPSEARPEPDSPSASSAWSTPPAATDASAAWSGARPPAAATAGADAPTGSLEWLWARRLAAARSGGAPFVTSRPSADPWDRLEASTAAEWDRGGFASSAASAAPPPMPMPTSAGAPAPPSRRRGPHPALWGSAAAVGVLVIGSAALLQTGAPRPLSSGPMMVGSPAPTNDATAGPIAPPPDSTSPSTAGPAAPGAPAGDPVRALAGAWALDGDCRQLTYLTVVERRLIGQGAAGPIEIGNVERVEPDGGVVVRAPGGGSATYRVSGATLTVTSGQRPTLHFTHCPTRGAATPANVAGEGALIAMAMAGAGAPTPEPPPIRDEVDVSAFAPKELRAGEAALVQVYLHLIDQAEAVDERARDADAHATPRGQTTLGVELARGTRVDIMLDAGGLGLDEPIQSVIWRGRPCAAQFAVAAPADARPGQRVLTARVLVDSVPLGRLGFTLTVAPGEAAAAAHAELTGAFAKRYARAFLSYSSLDRPEVLKTAQTLRATGIDYFQDILSIEPGEAWRERLFAEIDRCDLFLLFWSSHAAGSDWVRQEAEHALARRHGSSEASPDIRPIIIEGPPIPRPPASLAELHFNDMLRYVVVASELEAKARKADASG